MRTLRPFILGAGFLLGTLLIAAVACTTLPDPKFEKHDYPKGQAFVTEVTRPYEKLGEVKSKVNYPTLDPGREETDLCKNYYNKAVRDLVKMARKSGGDAVIDVRSVVFYEDGRSELFKTPECADDGQEGQILTRGIAIKWKPEPSPTPK